ncbi:MAG: sterol desaturase family protein [Alphaproteobacteria bacterium]|nr:sterol desaturase family protein [Alphaproteobacteria bacterium]
MSRIAKTRFVLTLLTLLLLGRVAGQFMARGGVASWLPPDALWHADLLPYGYLLIVQLVMLAVMAVAIWRLDHIRPRPALAAFMASTALVYGLVMIGRGVVGFLDLSAAAWFDAPISTPFHLVLAGWLLIFAEHIGGDGLRWRIRRGVRATTRIAAYPVIMIVCWALFFWLLRHGTTPKFAAYLPVVLGASAILMLELAAPYRRSWLPDRREVIQDGLFLVVVQIALPALITLAVVEFAAGRLAVSESGLWPHHWPIAVQACLMLLTGDLLRYWLHRASHGWRWLWRLHAVHHSPDDLYFLNVGRFHPLEKCLQFALDAAPFLLLGVGPEVITAYFVFYAVNGFFQHSNVDVRLGWLNWIVSGPELHRWHHSRKIKESDRNFGNNLIVWDVLFGTRFLPAEREVDVLGLKNPNYPKDFIAQTLAPITADPNQT